MSISKYDTIPANLLHMAQLAPIMREVDRQEVWAAGRLSPEEALARSLECSPQAMVATVDGRVMCAFGVGVVTALSDKGIPWFLASEEIAGHARGFLRISHGYVQDWKQNYRRLENYVDARNTGTVRWLRWLGFRVEDPAPFGIDQLPFHRFIWERDHV